MLDHEGKMALTPHQLGEAETMFLNYHNHQWSGIPSLGQVTTTLSSFVVSRDCFFLT
ncbi:protein of unknown function [Paenibacillus alvei]|uniref:Uncharacterized protein n=1 Tax=Paenibacillus alvei TaxID=44250 RepID=A0A383RCG4_PAEAL|nr:protein of unknown function [Paenibacillus alvei]